MDFSRIFLSFLVASHVEISTHFTFIPLLFSSSSLSLFFSFSFLLSLFSSFLFSLLFSFRFFLFYFSVSFESYKNDTDIWFDRLHFRHKKHSNGTIHGVNQTFLIARIWIWRKRLHQHHDVDPDFVWTRYRTWLGMDRHHVHHPLLFKINPILFPYLIAQRLLDKHAVEVIHYA